MANEQNLRPSEHKLTLEEQKKGAQKSAEVRRKRKGLKQALDFLLTLPLYEGDLEEDLKNLSGVKKGTNLTAEEAIALAQLQRALKGDSRAFELIRDTVGERVQESRQENEETLAKLDEVLKQIGGVI